MAASDYRICDRCGKKTFYDADLHYQHPETGPHALEAGKKSLTANYTIQGLGDWAVICKTCSKKYRCAVVNRLEKKPTQKTAKKQGSLPQGYPS